MYLILVISVINVSLLIINVNFNMGIKKWTLNLTELHTTGSWAHRDCQLVRGTIYYGWSDSGLIAGGTICPTNTR